MFILPRHFLVGIKSSEMRYTMCEHLFPSVLEMFKTTTVYRYAESRGLPMKFVRFVETEDPWDLDIIAYEVMPSLVVLNGEYIMRYMVPPTLKMLQFDFGDETIKHIDLNDVIPRREGEFFIEVTST